MNLLFAFILGIIQGVTEFLPLSSSGHLLLAEYFFDIPGNLFFNLLLHLATLLAVILFFWKEFIYCIKNPFSKQTLSLLISTIFTTILAIGLSKIPGLVEGVVLGPSFIITSIILVVSELISRTKKNKYKNSKITYKKACLVGIVQGVAVLPGISRSGSTISFLRSIGIGDEESSKFSFLMSIPIIIGGMIFEILKNQSAISHIGFGSCIIGFLSSFIFGLASLWIFSKLLKSSKWWVFAPYLFVLGVTITIWQYVI